MLTTRFASAMPQAFADDSSGFDYFATDFHYMNVAAEIRRQLIEQRGFVLLNGPPAPDATLLERYLDGSAAADDSDAAGFRANLVRCRPGWTFGDVVIAYSRELGLSPDAGAWSILSQVMQESRKGLTRVLILDNADALDDGGFDELRRFTRVDDPYILPVVLLAGPGFANRLERELRTMKGTVIGSLPLQHLMPTEVGAFIRYQIAPVGESYEGAFTPGAVATIAEAAEGDPRVVNRLARQHLDVFAGPRAPMATVRSDIDAEDVTVARDLPPLAKGSSPAAESPSEPAFMPSSPAALVQTVTSLTRPPRRPAERLARNLTVAAGLLFAGGYGIALLYSLVPEGLSDRSAPSATAALPPVTSRILAAPVPERTAERPPGQPPAAPGKLAAVAERPQTAAPKDATVSPGAAARQAASIEPSAAAATAPLARPAPAPEVVARAEPPPPPPSPPTVARAVPAAPQSAAPAPAPAAHSESPPSPLRVAAADPAPNSDVTPLVERGNRLLAAGDIASARDFFERAVEADDPAASCGMGKTYDPLFLQQVSMRGVAGDVTKAAAWYRRAAAAGNAEAAKRLGQLLAKYPPGTTGEGSSR